MKTYLILTIALIFFITNSIQAQELLKDDFTLKLSSISTNKKYGYSEKKPIKVGGIFSDEINAQNFLNALKGPNGEKVIFRRIGSCCYFKTPNALIGNKGVLDKYEVFYKGIKKQTFLYINEYDYEAPLCPKGFTYKIEEDIKEIKKVSPKDIKKVEVCSEEKIYAVDDFLLKEDLGEDLLTPEKSPQPIGGIDQLKMYFSKNPLKDERAKNTMFRAAIGFKVNCKGEAGNFFIATKGKGDLEELANQILEIVNNMDAKWIPAKDKNQDIDCYQILSFNVLEGKLNKVSIR